jgi:lipopolysaccharide biosynthesis glycosyltransferase
MLGNVFKYGQIGYSPDGSFTNSYIYLGDQGILNLLYLNRIKPMDEYMDRYNFTLCDQLFSPTYQTALSNARIVHFGYKKPWHDNRFSNIQIDEYPKCWETLLPFYDVWDKYNEVAATIVENKSV